MYEFQLNLKGIQKISRNVLSNANLTKIYLSLTALHHVDLPTTTHTVLPQAFHQPLAKIRNSKFCFRK